MLTEVAPFSDVNVRRALKYGINRQEMVDKILQGHGMVGNDSPIGPANQYYNADMEQLDFDPDKAKFYLGKQVLRRWTSICRRQTLPLKALLMAAQLYQASAAKARDQYQRDSRAGRWLLVERLDEKAMVCELLVGSCDRGLDVRNRL